MTYSVTFDKSISLTDDPALSPAPVRFQLTVTSVVGFNDLGIFTYEINQVSGESTYSHVATPNDLQDYNYQVAGGQEYVREASIDLYFDTSSLAAAALEAIETRIKELCDDMDALEEFGTSQETTISSDA